MSRNGKTLTINRPPSAAVLFAAAAGAGRGFGHLIRCGMLADALGVERVIALRHASATTTAAARRFGWRVCEGRDVLSNIRPSLLVVDDPSRVQTARWVRRARLQHVPVATVHDGNSAGVDADLVIDGSATVRTERRGSRIAGPAFVLLGAAIAARRTRAARQRLPHHILVSLGGGAHVLRSGAALAASIVRAVPGADVELATGFVKAAVATALPAGCRWVEAQNGLDELLASTSVAVVAGGITLYEACALGTPTVAVPVVSAQLPAIRAMSQAGAVIGVDALVGTTEARRQVADAVAALLDQPRTAAELARRARTLIDARGTHRVVARLHRLLHQTSPGVSRHAA